jgi:LmbE family N-acetylglucosaminyl deacetylase
MEDVNHDDVPVQVVGPLGTVVSIWAHPDDETYLSGGIMAAARDDGHRVVSVSLTAGEAGSDDPCWPPERLGRLRRWEHAASMAVLGVAEHHVLDFPDGCLADVDDDGPVVALAALLDEVRPDTVLTFGDDGITFHPDHRQVSRWVTAAWHRAGRPGSLLYACLLAEHLEEFGPIYERWGMYMTDERPIGRTPDELALAVRLTGAALDRKVAALEAMASQTRPTIDGIGRDLFARDVAVEAFVPAPGVEGTASCT